jgi:hypothetical protein
MNPASPTGFEASNIISAIDMLCSDHVSLNHMTASTGMNSPRYDLANSFEGIGTSISKIKPIFAPRTYPAYSNKAYTANGKLNGHGDMQVNDSDQLDSNGKGLVFPLPTPAPQSLCLAKVLR